MGNLIESFHAGYTRMKRPNVEPAVHPNAMHAIEHVVATCLRNTADAAGPESVAGLLRRAFACLARFRGEVPGATDKNCGNRRLHNIDEAKREAEGFLGRERKFRYAKTRRVTARGKTVYDA
ncbi:MAG: S-ribosylhomocysteine lyase [Kiritimatiellae bacterium]|nr:S-ribosylhomocysteine lyase [Kiritimatiellia bacterium]